MQLLQAIDSVLRSGRLLLPTSPSEAVRVVEPAPFLESFMVLVSVLLGVLFLRNFLNIIPYLLDNFTRARGSVALESSVRVSRDRNIVALILIIPCIMVINKYGIYEPDLIKGADEDVHLMVVAGVFFLYLLLRFLLWLAFRPKRGGDNYAMARKSAYTFFILMGLLVLPTVGILNLFSVNPLTVRTIILIEMTVIYLVYFVRKAQILSLGCSSWTVFLYLCALEILPTGLLILSAMIL